jgi:hypothetical protein
LDVGRLGLEPHRQPAGAPECEPALLLGAAN